MQAALRHSVEFRIQVLEFGVSGLGFGAIPLSGGGCVNPYVASLGLWGVFSYSMLLATLKLKRNSLSKCFRQFCGGGIL